MKNVLVTGCLGTIGIITINKLLQNNFNVIGIDNCSYNPLFRKNEIQSNGNFIYYNNDNISLDELFKLYRIDEVLHLASIIGALITNNDINYFNNNIKFTFDLLNISYKNNIEKFVLASSSSVYGEGSKRKASKETDIKDPKSLYAITKSNAEDYVNYFHNIHNMNTTILRYYNTLANIKYYGYRNVVSTFTDKILKGENITLYNNGKQKRQYVSAENIAYANCLALINLDDKINGETFNISVEDKPISLLDVTEILYNKLNKEPNYILSDEVKPGDVEINWGDISKAKELLDYKVLINQEKCINDYIDYRLNNKG